MSANAAKYSRLFHIAASVRSMPLLSLLWSGLKDVLSLGTLLWTLIDGSRQIPGFLKPRLWGVEVAFLWD